MPPDHRPAVLDHERDRTGVVLSRLRGQPDLSRPGVFQCVGDQVEQHLPQPSGIGQQRRRRAGGYADLKGDAALRRLRREHLGTGVKQPAQVEHARPDSQLAGLHLRHLQDVVDQCGQHVAGLACQSQQRLLRRRQAATAEQAQRIEQGVQRRADFMAYNGDEAGLRGVCRLRLGARTAQILLGLLVIADVGIQGDEAAIRQLVRRSSIVRPSGVRRCTTPCGAARSLGDPLLHFPLGIGYAPELAGGDLGAQNLLHRQADAQDLFRNAGDLRKPGIPLHQAEMAVEHRNAVGHARQRRLQALRLGGDQGAGDLQLRIGGGENSAARGHRSFPLAGEPEFRWPSPPPVRQAAR